jgi:MFS transporter, PAT family, beta-lactamase induction signal transducer AmpG
MNQSQSPRIMDALLNKRMLICLITGFSSGLPLYLLIQLVPAWFRREGIDLATIGLFNLVLFPYTWKFIWSPIMDRFSIPFLGRRRGWMIITQIPLVALMSILGTFSPAENLTPVIITVGAIAFFSASQDIVLDAYRRELLPDAELGVGNSFFTNAYKLSSLIPGALALVLADTIPWSMVHLVVAGFMALGLLSTFLIPETDAPLNTPKTLKEAVVEPFREFFSRPDGIKGALAILVFMLLYKLGDNLATALETPFFIDMGFSNTEIGTVAKISKLWAAVVGTIIGGIIMIRLGINKSLWLFGVVQVGSIFGYYLLAEAGNNLTMLFVAVSLEYIGVGLGTVALIAFMAKSTSRSFTATQFALLSSLVAVPRTFANASTGYLVEYLGWSQFYLLCMLVAIPGMLMLFKVAPWHGEQND